MLKNLIGVYKNELLVGGCAFLLRAVYAIGLHLTAGSHAFISFADAQYFYLQLAQNLLHHHAFSLATTAPFFADAYHTPLYPLFVAGLLFFHIPLLGIILIQNLLAALVVVMTYRIALQLTSSTTIALVASVVATLEPMSIYWGGLLMSDTLFAFLLVLSFYLLLQKRPYWCIAMLALATLTRPIGLYFLPFFIAMLVYQEYATSLGWRTIARKALLAIILFVAVLSPWLVRNKIVFNTWALSSAGWYEVYVGPLPVFAQQKGIAVPELPTKFTTEQRFKRFDFQYDAYYKQTFFSIVSHYPAEYTRFQLLYALSGVVHDHYDYLVHEVLMVKLPRLFAHIPPLGVSAALLLGELFWLGVYIFAATSFADKKLRPWWLFFAAVAAANLALSGAINPDGLNMSRYTLGLNPLLFIFAAAGLAYTRAKIALLTK